MAAARNTKQLEIIKYCGISITIVLNLRLY